MTRCFSPSSSLLALPLHQPPSCHHRHHSLLNIVILIVVAIIIIIISFAYSCHHHMRDCTSQCNGCARSWTSTFSSFRSLLSSTTTTAGNPKLPNMSVRARPQPPCCVPQVWGSPQRAAAWPRKIVVKAANGWPTARPTCERLCSTRPPTAGTTNSWWIIAYLPWPYLPVAS